MSTSVVTDRVALRSSAGRVGGLAVATALSRVLGFVRASVWAAAFGLYVVGNALTLANTLPTIIYTLLAGGAISSVFVPQMLRAATAGRADGDAYAGRLLTVALLVLLPATVVGMLSAPALAQAYTGGAWSVRDAALLAAFLVWCLPQIPLYGVFAIVSQVLLAQDRPGPMMWAPVANNVVGIVAALPFLVLGSVATGPDAGAAASVSTIEIAAIAGGATAGVLAQVLVLLPALRAAGVRIRPRLGLRGSGIGRSVRLAGWAVLFVAANQVAYSVTAVVASTAGAAAAGTTDHAAGIAQYTNASMIMLVPHAVVAVSVVTAAFPGMARAAVAADVATVADTAAASLVKAGRWLLPAAFALLITAPLVTRVLFPGTPTADTSYMGMVLAAFAPAVVVYSFQFVLVRTLQALEDTRRPALVQVLIALVQSLGAGIALLMLPPGYVVVGLGAAFSLAYLVGLVCTARIVGRATARRPVRAALSRLLRTGVAAGAAATVTGGLLAMYGADPEMTPLNATMTLLCAVAVYGLVFAAAANQPAELTARIRRITRRARRSE